MSNTQHAGVFHVELLQLKYAAANIEECKKKDVNCCSQISEVQ